MVVDNTWIHVYPPNLMIPPTPHSPPDGLRGATTRRLMRIRGKLSISIQKLEKLVTKLPRPSRKRERCRPPQWPYNIRCYSLASVSRLRVAWLLTRPPAPEMPTGSKKVPVSAIRGCGRAAVGAWTDIYATSTFNPRKNHPSGGSGILKRS